MDGISLHNSLFPAQEDEHLDWLGHFFTDGQDYVGSGSRTRLAVSSLIPTLKLSDCSARGLDCLSGEHTGSWVLAGFMASQKKATFPGFPWSKCGYLTIF